MKNRKKILFYYALKYNFILKTDKDFTVEEMPLLLVPYILHINKLNKSDFLDTDIISEEYFFEKFYGFKY